jgi:hypothetical protein
MADRKGTARAPRSGSAPRMVSNKNNVALPFSRLTVHQPTKMTVGDWISLAGLVVTVIGFSVVIRQLVQTANPPEGNQAIR